MLRHGHQILGCPLSFGPEPKARLISLASDAPRPHPVYAARLPGPTMAPSFFVPVSTEALSLRDCINVCGAAGGMPACASGTEAGTCDVWLGHHRHEFDSGPFNSCLASPTGPAQVIRHAF